MEGDGDESLVNEGEVQALLPVAEVGLNAILLLLTDCFAA